MISDREAACCQVRIFYTIKELLIYHWCPRSIFVVLSGLVALAVLLLTSAVVGGNSHFAYAADSGQQVQSENVEVCGLSFEMYANGFRYLVSPTNAALPRDEINESKMLSDGGLIYLLSNGYPATKVSEEKQLKGTQEKCVNYFLTQVGIWLYLGYEYEDIAAEYPQEAKDLIEKYSLPMVREASSMADREYDEVRRASVIHLDGVDDGLLRLNKSRYESYPQKVTLLNKGVFQVSVDGYPIETVRNGDNIERSSFNSGESFMVSIPSEDIEADTSVNAEVSCETELPVLKLDESDSGKLLMYLGRDEGPTLAKTSVTWTISLNENAERNFTASMNKVSALSISIVVVVCLGMLFERMKNTKSQKYISENGGRDDSKKA